MIVEPFDVLFWALGIVLTHIVHQVTQPAGLTSLNRGTEWHGTVRQGSVRSNLIEDALAPSLFPSSCIIYLWLAVWPAENYITLNGFPYGNENS